jgi:hypothetical protein
VRFIRGQARKFNKSSILAGFSGLPHGLELLEGNVHDQDSFPKNQAFWLMGKTFMWKNVGK